MYTVDLRNQLRLEVSYTKEFGVDARRNTADSVKPILYVNEVTNTGNVVVNNPVTFSWALSTDCFNDSIPNYQFQLLRLFNRDTTLTTDETDIRDTIDWSRALSIETGSPATSLTLTVAEGRGYYIWRVRPIGDYYPGGIANDRNWGLWSRTYSDGDVVFIDGLGESNITNDSIRKSIFFYSQFDDSKNWIYGRTFSEGSEGTRIAEQITYASELLMTKQTQGRVRSSDTLLARQTAYDFTGRAAFSSLPAPIKGPGFRYWTGFLKHGMALYTAANFDDDDNFRNPDPLDSGRVHLYYSNLNQNLRVPNAEHYGFSRTLYYPDASSLVHKQSGPGYYHRLVDSVGITDHVVKTYYGTPSDKELIAMFGDEAPVANSVRKITTIDPNKVAAIRYVSKEGNTIATCLASGENPYQAELTGEAKFDENVFSYGVRDRGGVSSTTVTLLTPQTVKLRYTLTPDTVQAECGSFCATCDYEIIFEVTNTERPWEAPLYLDTVLVPADSCHLAAPYTIGPVNVVIPSEGSYRFTRRIRSYTRVPGSETSDPPHGRTYLDDHLAQVRQETLADLPVAVDSVRTYLAMEQPDLLYSYLATLPAGVALTVNGTDSTYELRSECCTLSVPVKRCSAPSCDSLPSFEQMLYDEWGPNSAYHQRTGHDFGETPREYFRRSREPLYPNVPPFENWGKGAFDAMIGHMIDSGYSCRELLTCWRHLVKSFRTNVIDKPEGEAFTSEDINRDYDLLEAFLSCTGTMYRGVSTCAYGDCYNDGSYYERGYLEYAFAFFRYPDGGARCQMCEDQYGMAPVDGSGTPIRPPVEPPDDRHAADSNQTWKRFIRCARSCNRRDEKGEEELGLPPCMFSNGLYGDTTCVAELRDRLRDTCYVACEDRRGAFEEELRKLYFQEGKAIEGDTVMWDGDTIALGTVFVPRATLECQIQALIDTCRFGCHLSMDVELITELPLPGGDTLRWYRVDTVGTYQERREYAKSMYSMFRIGFPDEMENCSDSLRLVRGGSGSLLFTRGAVARLNDSLRAYRRNGAGSPSAVYDTLQHLIYDLIGPSSTCRWSWGGALSRKGGAGAQSVEEEEEDGNVCCPARTLPALFTLDSTITDAEFVLLDTCVLAYRRVCMINGIPYETIDTVCTDICTETCEPSLCFAWIATEPKDTLAIILPVLCEQETSWWLSSELERQIDECVERQLASVRQSYAQECAYNFTVDDEFKIEYGIEQYHFTLFYYDRAGNLTSTVPPLGVSLNSLSRMVHPNHQLVTRYEYNSLKQLTSQRTPDGGATTFMYDDAGRVRYSVGMRQAMMIRPRYSYTKYDRLGRTTEVGEALMPSPASILPQRVNDQSYPRFGQKYVTYTSYTTPTGLFPGYCNNGNRPQRYLRNRVSSTQTESGVLTVYSYDPHGNVEWMGSKIPGIGWNFVGYRYDLISGNVLEVEYDAGWKDEFRQRYSYDADNRVVKVESSRHGGLWDRDAGYEYFAHGPLARTMLGEDSLQGLDYTYTIQGWLKGINHARQLASWDPGNDSATPTRRYAPDAFGMVLGYYPGDFARRRGMGANSHSNNSVFNNTPSAGYLARPENLNGDPLYNGNISSWTVGHSPVPGGMVPFPPPGGGPFKYPGMTGNAYKYDVLNRLLTSDFKIYSGSPLFWTTSLSDYDEAFTYDPNGNILTLERRAIVRGASNVMDQFVYDYAYQRVGIGPDSSNRLLRVGDNLASGPTQFDSDIDHQTPGVDNYKYDGSGNLIYDAQEGTQIKWNGYGKVEEVRKIVAGITRTIRFVYNGAGNRVKKLVYNHAALGHPDSVAAITYYVRDANEQVMAVYEQTGHYIGGSTTNCWTTPGGPGDPDGDGILEPPAAIGCDRCFPANDPWQENYDQDGLIDACDPCPMQVTCPSSDTATMQPVVEPWSALQTKLVELYVYGSGAQGRVAVYRADTLRDTTKYVNNVYTRLVGKKEYELKDHLDNIRIVISDVKLNSGGIAMATFSVKVLTVNNYYAFGMLEPGRSWQSRGYRYGYHSKESDNEWKGSSNSIDGSGESLDYGARILDPRLGRWLSMDPMSTIYPSLNPYNEMGNNPINFIDPTGCLIDFTKYAKTEDEAKKNEELFLEALKYLESRDTESGRKLRRLYEDKNPETTVYLNVVYALDGMVRNPKDFLEYKHVSNTINWDPGAGLAYTALDGTLQVMSPALGLGHEGVHAWSDIYEPDEFQKRLYTKDESYENEEERNATLAESRDAMSLGEVTVIRPSHRGEPIKTLSSTTNKTLEDQAKEMRKAEEERRSLEKKEKQKTKGKKK